MVMTQKIIKNICWTFSAFFVLWGTLNTVSQAGDKYEFWPGAEYDAAIPTYQKILGYDPGTKITSHADMIRYFDALSQAAPDRMKITEYATSWEDRRLIYAAISNPSNIAALPALQDGMKKLSDPSQITQATADQLINTLPATIWLSYGVHGDELSPTDAAMMTAYHLLASKNNDQVDQIMTNVVSFIDPLQNPDGRERFVHHYRTAKGLLADGSRLSVEQNHAWPSGLFNHYLFNLNRDWFALTQPETIGKVKALQDWPPLVFVDLHEMYGNQSYYFPPVATPINPHITKDQTHSLKLFGLNNAKWFDEFGFEYFTREIFDAFYPGYGASWPAYSGAISMTYEQGSSRGLMFRRLDGTDLHYQDTVRHHFVASLATAETTAINRIEFLRNYYNYRKTAIEEGYKGKVKSYIIPTQKDQAAAIKLAGILVKQGIDVREADQSFRACGVSYEKGSYVINMAQPAKRLINILMDDKVEMKEAYLEEQERLRIKDIPTTMYDVTAWSLPLMYNIVKNDCSSTVKNDFPKASTSLYTPAKIQNPNAKIAFLVPWGQATSARLLTNALRAGLTVKSSDKSFVSQGREYPSGSLVFEVKANPDNLSKTLSRLAQLTGAEVYGVNSSWVTDGPNFGSSRMVKILAPRVAIVWDEPTNPDSAGNTRFIIERQFDYPTTILRTEQLVSANLGSFQVLIMPSTYTNYKGKLGQKGSDNIKGWVDRGGTLIALGTAMQYVSDPDVDLMSTRREDQNRDIKIKEAIVDAKSGTLEGSYLKDWKDVKSAIAPLREKPERIPGVLVKATVDHDHWLAAGLADQLNVLVRGQDIYSPIRLDNGYNVASFNDEDELLASGYLWEESRKQLAHKPFLMIQPRGLGHVIGFTQDPTTRAYLDGLNIVLMNAIFRASAHSKPLR